ncbi:GGDEF domain-containing protein [Phytopseudomonas punonensis]|uniref:diguanylate cyclase n=1 Tax=Phytopseudomonas punonensis TaxID=1220495 RepID=A0A1M7GU48_9GAMM|nr:GGDEF domain-containing protein [Pseudomonas punonensis]SHM19638.1 diguanylate cyclase (GGDEF) domain-containing protein [Pseudomonas punonensis]
MLPPIDHSDQSRRRMFKTLLWVTMCFGVLFSIFNATRGLWLLVGIEVIYTTLALYMLVVVERTRHLKALTIVYLIPFLGVMMATLANPNTSVGIFAWIQTIPIILYLLLGLRLGLIGSLIFVSLGLYLYTQHYTEKNPSDSIGFLLDIGMATLAITIFSHTYEHTRAENEKRLIELIRTDYLTGLANRSKLTEIFCRERAHAQRNQSPLALVYLDIDHFKQINDRFGHETGDQALCHFASVLSQRLRETDLLCRLGGEEFAALLPNTSAAQATRIAEQLREQLESNPMDVQGMPLHMTLSAGVASLGRDGERLDQLMSAADKRTYAAKRAGRNQVVGGEVAVAS